MAFVALSLLGVLALQLWLCRGKLNAAFLDTRLHYNFDNAEFSFKARSGNRNGDLRSQFGVTDNVYESWGKRVGGPTYYTDHPFLVKALFQQYTKIVGTEEWASRSFSLAVSFAIAAGLYVLLLQTTGDLLSAFAGAATFASLPVCAVYQTSVKFETDGMLVGVWLFVALAAFLRTGRRLFLVVYAVLAGLAVLTHWTAILFVVAVALGLWILSWRRSDPRAKRALWITAVAGAAGALALVAALSFLQGGWTAALRALAAAFVRRSMPIDTKTWWVRQWFYAKLNFGVGMGALVLGPTLMLAARRRWLGSASSEGQARRSLDLLSLFILATLTVACVWVLAFPQGSSTHVYWQYWLSLPIAALVAAGLASLRDSRWGLALGVAGSGALLILLLAASRESYARVIADQLGTPEDITFLRSLREDRFHRFVFVPVTDSPLNSWFQGPLFEYYTDRPVAMASSGSGLSEGDKLLVLRFVQREKVIDGLEGWSHKKLANEQCGERICAYDVLRQN